MDDSDRDLEGWLDNAVIALKAVYGKDSMPVNYFQQIYDAHLQSADDDGLIPKGSENLTFEAAYFHLQKFIETFWEPDVRTDFSQLEHLRHSIGQDIAALESQHLALNNATLSSWLTTTKELMATRFGTHSSKYTDFSELKENFEKQYKAAAISPDRETVKHDYYLRGRQKILAVINQLKSEIDQMNITPPKETPAPKGFFHQFKQINGIVWGLIITLFVAGVSGAYILGKDNASAKFDREKINLERENLDLKTKREADENKISILRDSIKMASDTAH